MSALKPFDRKAIGPALTIGLVLWAAGLINAPASEHNRTRLSHAIGANEARAQEPTPAPDVEPIAPSVEQPTFGLKKRYDIGEPIVVPLQLPAGEKLLDVEWEIPLQYVSPPESLTTIYVWPMGSGSWPVRANYVVDVSGAIKIRKHVETLNVGEPEPAPPPKLLAPLVTKEQAGLLSTWYRATINVVDRLATPDSFLTAHASELGRMGLAGSPYATEVAKRFEGIGTDELDRVKLVACLEGVVRELGAPPVVVTPDTPPVDPNATPVSFDGFHVVFIEEGSKRPAWLNDLLLDPAIEGYLNSHCLGGQKGWRRWDQNAVLTNAPSNLRTLAELPRTSVPAIHVAWNKQAAVLPLGKQTPTELLATLKKYGGP